MSSTPGVEPLEPRIAPATVVGVDLTKLSSTGGFTVDGTTAAQNIGLTVSAAGDMNGDGLDDFLVCSGGTSGTCYVVFGSATPFPEHLSIADFDGTNGFTIFSGSAGDRLGRSASAAGDVNKDGFADIVIGASSAAGGGAAYVIFGHGTAFPATLDVGTLSGSDGFKIVPQGPDQLGASVSGGGDFNGDGYADVILGAPNAAGPGLIRGLTYVVFGHANPFPPTFSLVNLTAASGLSIAGSADFDAIGDAVSNAGDVNGDGKDDILIGASGAGSDGAAYVVYGSAGTGTTIVLSALNGTNGFSILSAESGSNFGRSVAGGGDLNGDGLADVAIGAAASDLGGKDSGAVYVVYGKSGARSAQIKVSDLNGTDGFQLLGKAGDMAGFSLGIAKDINDDGADDLIVGALGADKTSLSDGGAYVVFGSKSAVPKTSKLGALNGKTGFKVKGGDAIGFSTGYSVSGAGDVNGDGYNDYLVGAPGASPSGTESGSAYVLFGSPATISSAKTVSYTDPNGDRVTVQVTKGTLRPSDLAFQESGSGNLLKTINLSYDLVPGGKKAPVVNLIVSGKPQKIGGVLTGDGLVDVGEVVATGRDLGVVKISGNLGQITAGDSIAKVPAVRSITIGSLGSDTPLPEPLVSTFLGSVGSLTVKRDVKTAAVVVVDRLKKATIGGDLVGEAPALPTLLASLDFLRSTDPRVGGGIPVGAFNASSVGTFSVHGNMDGGSVGSSGDIDSVNVGQNLRNGTLAANGRIKVVKVFGSLTADDETQPTVIAAQARVGSTKPAGAVALDVLMVKGDVENARILLGYNKEKSPTNPDASVGKVIVNGGWKASSLAAGVVDTSADGFGQNDTLIAGNMTPNLLARIGSIVIKGTAAGSASVGDYFAITAEQIGKATINGNKLELSKTEKDNVLLDETNQDFRLIEI